jgi:hypothetical protein
MPAPPAAIRRWNSIRLADTRPAGLRPSNVAAFSTRLRSRAGPRGAGAKGSACMVPSQCPVTRQGRAAATIVSQQTGAVAG